MCSNLIQKAQNNRWIGIVMNGCIRDMDEINKCDIGVNTPNLHPMGASPLLAPGYATTSGSMLDTDDIHISRAELIM
jgi:hypothetical protein